MKTKTNISS